ncbi:MAG: Asp23/Gls24 family envelope stress response protein [Candidatus Omnitrophica bacterium]|nr:Asp23/Gls24 family envelope stress response protein [Candidatus Omnitrophota bacterium]
MKEVTNTELGTFEINEDVMASIAIQAAKETEGVYSVGDDIKSKLKGLFGGRGFKPGIKLVSESDGSLKIDLSIIVDFGVAIPSVATEVQENVRRRVEEAVRVAPAQVNVRVRGIHINTNRGGF